MLNTDRSGRLEMRWLPVESSTGRTHMEAVWITVDAAGSALASPAVGAASSHAA